MLTHIYLINLTKNAIASYHYMHACTQQKISDFIENIHRDLRNSRY